MARIPPTHLFCLALASAAFGAGLPAPVRADASPTPAGGCLTPGAPARILEKRAMPAIPEGALTEGAATYVVRIRIQMSKDGAASNPQYVKRSGNLEIDASALQAATSMRYTPEYVDCQPIPGAYELQFEFALHPLNASGSQSSLNQVTILSPPCPGDRGPILISAPGMPRVKIAHGRVLSPVAIDLYVDESGEVTSTRIVRSSGDKGVDALIAARAARARFEPAIYACRQAAGVYLLHASFHPNAHGS